MLECHEFLSWLVEVMEKIKAHDDHTLRFVMPLCTQVGSYGFTATFLSNITKNLNSDSLITCIYYHVKGT